MITAVVALLEAILTDLPKLDGAACRGRHEMFDPIRGNGHLYQQEERIRFAKDRPDLRAGCPVIHRCPDVTTTAGNAA
ncbi:MAG: hypothetical protein ACRDS0_31685 [Pseudonocardiaceae bacterium]